MNDLLATAFFSLGYDRALTEGLAWIGVIVFALSGALAAARRGMDPFGFALLAVCAAVGGGAVRDALLSVPASWVRDPSALVIAGGAGFAAFLVGRIAPGSLPWLEKRRALAWLDAAGLAIFAVAGAERALNFGAHWLTAIALGAATASFGGVIRDILAGERPMILHREIYFTAAVLGAGVYVAGRWFAVPLPLATIAAVAAGFGLRALALWRNWSLPAYEPPAGDRDPA